MYFFLITEFCGVENRLKPIQLVSLYVSKEEGFHILFLIQVNYKQGRDQGMQMEAYGPTDHSVCLHPLQEIKFAVTYIPLAKNMASSP